MRAMRLVATGFAVGAAEHAVGFVLLGFGVHIYHHYPAWRHAALSVVDALIAYVAAKRPERALVPLVALLFEQIATHGPELWRQWQMTHRLSWTEVVVQALVVAAAIAAAIYRRATIGDSRRDPVAQW